MAKLNAIQPVSTGFVTPDGTIATAATFDTSPWTNAVFQITINVLGYDLAANEAAGYILVATFKRTAGTLAIVGTATVDHSAESDAAWTATLDASGNDIRVRVTGQATAVTWVVDGYVFINALPAVRGDN